MSIATPCDPLPCLPLRQRASVRSAIVCFALRIGLVFLPHRANSADRCLITEASFCSPPAIYRELHLHSDMGKLRDWWPSDEMLEHSRSSNSASASRANAATVGNAASEQASVSPISRSTYTHTHVDPLASASASSLSAMPFSGATVTLRLSEVTAALNAMPTVHSSSLPSTPNEPMNISTCSSPSPQLSLSRPAIKLTNSQDHKEELLKKLLSRSESSSDLQIGLQYSGRGITPHPSSPLPQSRRSQGQEKTNGTCADSRDVGSQANGIKESTKLLVNVEDVCDARKRKRDMELSLRCSTISSKDTQDQILPAPTPELSGISKDSLSRREIHIFSERQRRKGMTHLYAILHSLLPDAKSKTDRCTVLTDAMEYIYELQSRLDELGRHKSEIMAALREQLNADSSTGMDDAEPVRNMGVEDLITEEMREEILAAADVAVRLCGRDAFITLYSPKHNGVWSAILQVLHQQDLELLNVTLSTSNEMDYHCIHAKVLNSEFQIEELQKMLEDVVLNHAILD